jgi:NitT/TauT family transport system substrate-binding protein
MAAVLAAAIGLALLLRADTGKPVAIVMAYSPFESTALVWIAEERQFFRQNGLNITTRKYDSGAGALDGMINGEADLVVGTTEFPLVGKAFQQAKIRAIAGIAKSDFIYLIARMDRGIGQVADLKGKEVGTTFGTIAEFFLGRFLTLNGMSTRDITLIDVKKPEEWVNAVADGDIDAISTAQPYADAAKKRLGDNAITWPAQSSRRLYALVIADEAWIAKHPELAIRFLKSLSQAEDYAERHPAEAKAIVGKRLDLDAAYMETVWSQNQFTLSLEQSLILAMEDEARWMIKQKLTPEKQVPNFLDYIYEDGLKAVKPAAVNIIR